MPGINFVHFKSEHGFQFKSNLAAKQNAINAICTIFRIPIQSMLYIGNAKSEVEFLKYIKQNNGYVILNENELEECLWSAVAHDGR